MIFFSPYAVNLINDDVYLTFLHRFEQLRDCNVGVGCTSSGDWWQPHRVLRRPLKKIHWERYFQPLGTKRLMS